MPSRIDQEILRGFVEEAKSYLPKILDGLERFRRDPLQREAVQEALRLMHIIKGASSMLGLASLGHIAAQAEEAIEDIAEGRRTPDPDAMGLMNRTAMQIEVYLEGAMTGSVQEKAFLHEVTHAFRRWRGLSEASEQEAPRSGPPPQAIASGSEPAAGSASESEARELLEAFHLEAQDHLASVERLLPQLGEDSDHADSIQELRRSIHTLKGAASVVGHRPIAQLTHRMEDLLDALFEGKLNLSAETRELLAASAELLHELLIHADVSEAGPAAPRLEELYTRYARLLAGIVSSEPPHAPEALPGAAAEPAAPEPLPTASRMPRPAAPASGQLVRVPLEGLDGAVKLVGELVIQRSTFEGHHLRLRHRVEQLHDTIERLRSVAARIEIEYEASTLGGGFRARSLRASGGNGGIAKPRRAAQSFDALELDRYTEFHLLSRELTEAVADIGAVDNEMQDLVGDFDAALHRQQRLTGEVQDKLMRLRMVPVSTLVPRLQRAARVTSRQKDKLVDLAVEGGEVELDKTVLDQIADPLLHLVRNAVDHGIEPPALRREIGKPERGRILLQASVSATQVILQVGDDGAGLDPGLLREAAVRNGLVSGDQAATLTLEQLHELVFLPGFSTAEQVSEVSGRGVGMDVVRTAVRKLKGSVSLDSTPGRGLICTIRMPLSLAVVRVLLVVASGQVFALPLAAVTRILRIERKQIQRVGNDEMIQVEGAVYPLLHLEAVLHLPEAPRDEEIPPLVLVLQAGERSFALSVEAFLGGRDVVAKSLGSHLRRVPGISGATLLGDGSVVLILEPAELTPDLALQRRTRWPAALAPAQRRPDILVVDDSFSVRRVLANLLRKAGWNPIEAKDGLDALEILERSPKSPDLVLLDVEMPRMDGYELVSSLRAHERYRRLPVVMLTSRSGEKHRHKAFQSGATDYLVKPFQENSLLDLIRRRVQEAHGSRAP
jgi:chemosensory pili system protein ChpA (sensor histidine kinase/response regulator)